MDLYTSRAIAIQTGAFKCPSLLQEELDNISPDASNELDALLDKDYQSLFLNKGIRKAQEVLQYVEQEYHRWLSSANVHSDEDFARLRRSTAVVSIGGADGSELKALMHKLNSHYGILIEISPYAAAVARTHGIDVVIEDDVMSAASEVVSQLIDWQEHGEISTVLISCQSVLHELPTRSASFTMENFLLAYLAPLVDAGLRVMFYAREPCPPRNWSETTDAVAVRLVNMDTQDVAAVAAYIAEELNIRPGITSTYLSSDGIRLVLPVVLAQELLFKMLYWKDMEHLQYEMGEQLTSFRPEDWSRLLMNMNIHSRLRYLTTDHFSTLYQREEFLLGEPIATNPRNGDRLDMPKCFVQLFASSVMSN